MKILNIHVTMGLPGSGKSTYAENFGKSHDNCSVIHCDDFINSYNNKNKDILFVRPGIQKLGVYWQPIRNTNDSQKTIFIDGMMLSNKDIVHIVTPAIKHFYNTDQLNITVEKWNEDRETCLLNDKGRRTKESTETILRANIEELNADYIKNELNLDIPIELYVCDHRVELKPDWLRCASEFVQIPYDGILRSNKWVVGGVYGNYEGERYSISPDSPEEFVELDSMLENLCPEMNFINYKKLLKECVYTEETTKSDYYASETHYQNWACELEKVYNMLDEMGYTHNKNN